MGRVTAIFYGLAAALLPVGAVLSHRNVPIVLAVMALPGLWAVLVSFRQSLPEKWIMALFALMGWAALTTLWSPYGDAEIWAVYLLLLGLLSMAAMLSGGSREVRWIAVSAAFSLLLLTFESMSGGWLRDVIPPEGRPDKDDVATARGITIILAMVPGLLLLVHRTQGKPVFVSGFILVGAVICALSFGVTANILAVIAAAGAAGIVAVWPKWGLKLVVYAAALPFFLMPLIAMTLPPIEVLAQLEGGPASWRMRLVAWKAIWDGTTDGTLQLIFGHGVEGARVLGAQLGSFSLPGTVGNHHAIPTHPHNVYLHIWFDLGAVGVALSLAALGFATRALQTAALSRPVLMAAAALTAGETVFALIDASLWTLWRVAAPIMGAWLIAKVTGHVPVKAQA